MNLTREQLHAQCVRLRTDHPGHAKAMREAVANAPHVDYALLRGLASRETNIQNVVGDGGHGRTYFQIDDRSHGEWLRKVGTVNGLPPVSEAAKYAVAILEENVREAKAAGVKPGHCLAVAVAGYNCGMGNAIAAYRAGNVDARTASGNRLGTGDYSADVIARAKTIRQARWT